ncbi:MAG: ABC transporter ATP-binding protein [Ferruginibacter sp.]
MFLKDSTIAAFARNNKAFIILTLLAGITGTISTIFISLSIGNFYQIIFHDDGNKTRILSLIGFHTVKSVQYFFIFYAFLLFIKAGADWLFSYLSKVSATNLSRGIKNKLFEHQLYTRFDLFSNKSPSRYLLRYSGDLQAIQELYVKGILVFIKDVALLTIGFYFLFKINIGLSLIFLAAVPVLFFINYLFNIPIRKLIKEKSDQKSDLLSFVNHCFHAILSVKALRKEKIEAARFKKKSEKLYHTSVKYFFHAAFVQTVPAVLFYSVIGIVFLTVATNQVNISHGHLMAFVLVSMLQLSALRRVVRVETTWRSGNSALQKINGLLNATTEEGKIDVAILPFVSIKFENLPLNKTASKESSINTNINQGSIHNISCNNSEQLIRILMGIESVNKGQVYLNDQPISTFIPVQLRNLFSFSSDYLPLYGRDLYEMIVRGKRNGMGDEVMKILNDIGFDLAGKPVFIKTSLERNNIILSIEERKLISLARALLVDNPVLILDRPFDGVNAETVRECTRYLKSLLPKKTIIIISNANELSNRNFESVASCLNS